MARPLPPAHRRPRRAGHRTHPRPHRHLRPGHHRGLYNFPIHAPELPCGRGLAGFFGRPDGRMAALVPPVAGGLRLGRPRSAGSRSVDQRRGLRADHPRRGGLAALKSPVAVVGAGRHCDPRGFLALDLLGVSPHNRAPLCPVDAPRLDPIGGLPQPKDDRAPAVRRGFHRAGRPDPLAGCGVDWHWRPHPAASPGASKPSSLARSRLCPCWRYWRTTGRPPGT